MHKTKALLLISIATMLASCLSSCSGDNFKTPYTDALKLKHTVVASEKFTEPTDGVHALGEVSIAEVVDGDTFNFVNGKGVDPKTTSDTTHTVRFLGVNTPESTARIEPWGVKASQYVKSILWDNNANKQRPVSVVIQNDISVFGQDDGTSSKRFLGFVWYKMNDNSDYRLLNLEIIEQCYSVNLLSSYSDFCPYLDSFLEAAKVGFKNRKRVFGEKDPGFDYSNTILDVSIRYIVENYENLGVSSTDDSTSSDSGVKVRITGIIVGFSGNSIFIRDVVDPYPTGQYASIYVYTALTVVGMSQMYKAGDIISFVGKATTYHGNIQITDVNNVTTGTKDEKITTILKVSDYGITRNSDWNDDTKYNALLKAANELGYHYDVMPVDNVTAFNSISNINDLQSYIGDFVKVKLTIRQGEASDDKPTGEEKVEDFYRYDSDGQSLTFFAKNQNGVKISIRSAYYQSGYYGINAFSVGSTYYLIGQVAKHYDGYQIVLPNKYMISKAYGELGYAYLAK